MSRKFKLLAASASLLLASTNTPAIATPASGMSTEQLSKGVYDPMDLNTGSDRNVDKDDKWDLKLMTKDLSDVYVVRNTFAPGGQSGWHTHPGPSLITVTAGQITVYEGDGLCQPRVFGVGDGSVDVGSGHLHNIKNEGTASAVTVVSQIIPHDATRRVDADQPNNCSF